MMDTIIGINLISTNPAVRSGRLCIAGTTIEVSALVIAKIVHMQTPDEIAADYRLSLAQVYEALAYYYDHKAEIDDMMQKNREFVAAFTAKRIASRHSPLFG